MYSKHIYQDYNQMLFIHRLLGSQTLTGSHESLTWEKCTYKFSHTIQLLQRGFHHSYKWYNTGCTNNFGAHLLVRQLSQNWNRKLTGTS